jgi:hypothetical protein
MISMGGNKAIVLDYATIKFERNTVTIESFLGETFTGLSKIRAIAILNRLEKEFNGV